MSQSILLTRRLTTFLSQNTTPQLPTLILLSPTGKLLSSASPLPASQLRTQATIACSLWTTYHASTPAHIRAALPPSRDPASSVQHHAEDERAPSSDGSASTSTAAEHDTDAGDEVASLTIQLTHGIMVIRALTCGLIFVAMGPTTITSTSTGSHTHAQSRSNDTTPPPSPPEHHEVGGIGGALEEGRRSLAPSEVGSVGSGGTRAGTGTGRGGIMGVKRRAGEVARWLDEQLEGFALSAGVER